MTVVVEHGDDAGEPAVSTDQLADAMAEAQVAAAHQLEAEATIERAETTADAALETAAAAASEVYTHDHAEYARVEHDHPDYESRLAACEAYIAGAVVDAAPATEVQVEEIEPQPDTTSAEIVTEEIPASTKRFGFRRGR